MSTPFENGFVKVNTKETRVIDVVKNYRISDEGEFNYVIINCTGILMSEHYVIAVASHRNTALEIAIAFRNGYPFQLFKVINIKTGEEL